MLYDGKDVPCALSLWTFSTVYVAFWLFSSGALQFASLYLVRGFNCTMYVS